MFETLPEILTTVLLMSTEDVGPVFKTAKMNLEKYTYEPLVLK